MVILGGSKVSDKLGVIGNLIPHVDRLLIGGGMAFTFLAAQGFSVGDSLLEADQLATVEAYLEQASRRGIEVVLPVDVVVADRFAADANIKVVAADEIPERLDGVWISARKPWRSLLGTSPLQAQSCGTGRWVCSRWSRSRRGPGRSQTPWRKPLG